MLKTKNKYSLDYEVIDCEQKLNNLEIVVNSIEVYFDQIKSMFIPTDQKGLTLIDRYKAIENELPDEMSDEMYIKYESIREKLREIISLHS